MPAFHGQLFSSTQIPVCLGFLAKNKHDGSVVETEPALAIMKLALREIEIDSAPPAGAGPNTFRSNPHPDLRAI